MTTTLDEKLIISLLDEISSTKRLSDSKWSKLLGKYPHPENRHLRRSEIYLDYLRLVKKGKYQKDSNLELKLKSKPSRTNSGVVPVTVLTKPFPCPGKCIFCPTDYRMPKSYLRDEPGAMRAERHKFDPYDQTFNRIKAFEANGHETDKIELLILGGTWSSYPTDYQEEFIKRCFDGMNGSDSTDLEEAQKLNVTSKHRNVGLVLETRPDHITEDEIIKMRRYGATKIQIGIQSVRNEILEMNNRGETIEDSKKAIKLLRLAGFKIHAHWMPNLYGASLDTDREDYPKLWSDIELMPDELKIYPCSVLKNAELYAYYLAGKFKGYTEEELTKLLVDIKPLTPRYARLSRVIRDIPSTDIVTGNKKTNLRQIVQGQMAMKGVTCQCIRCREIGQREIVSDDVVAENIEYHTPYSVEYFLSYKTKSTDRILGFLRLTIPNENERKKHFIDELKNSAIIREVHVYGKSLRIGQGSAKSAQHLGLGTRLIHDAMKLSLSYNVNNIAVISAIGTREYYRKKGFELKDLYMHADIAKTLN